MKNLILDEIQPGQQNKEASIFDRRSGLNLVSMISLAKAGPVLMNMTLSLPKVQKLLNGDEKFDVVLGRVFSIESMLAVFSQKYNAPIIALATFMPNHWANYMVDMQKNKQHSDY